MRGLNPHVMLYQPASYREVSVHVSHPAICWEDLPIAAVSSLTLEIYAPD